MNASSRQVMRVAIAALSCLTAVAMAQPGGDEPSKKELKQMRQQERREQSGGGGGGNQGGGPQRIQPSIGAQSGPGSSFQRNDGPPAGVQFQPKKNNDDGPGRPQFPSPNQDNAQVENAKQAQKRQEQLERQQQKQQQDAQKLLQQREQQQKKDQEQQQKQQEQQEQAARQAEARREQLLKKSQNDNVSDKGKRDNGRGPVSTPVINATPFVPGGVEELSKKEQKESKKNQPDAVNQNKGKGRGPVATPGPDATPFVPAGVPPGGEDLSKKEQKKLEQEQKKAEQEQKKALQEQEKQQNRLEKLQKQGKIAATPGVGETPAAGVVVPGLELGKGKGNKGKNDKGALPPGATPGPEGLAGAAVINPGLSKKELKMQAKDANQAQKAAQQAAKQLEQMEKKQQKLDFKNLSGAQTAALIGADISGKHGNKWAEKQLSKNDIQNQFGTVNIIKNKVVNKTVINQINMGVMPAGYGVPWGGYGFVRRPLIAVDPGCSWCLPPAPPVLRGGFNFNLSWNYWDGRCRYDQYYCDNVFQNVGHVRYEGCDGAVVGGRYYCYGWGWMDGCIDYGSRRMWVPGFYAPYTVEECGNIPVWLPPVYEDVWTGCCWETVQVDGGYFAPSPSVECHLVTRYTWVPGHFEYYWA